MIESQLRWFDFGHVWRSYIDSVVWKVDQRRTAQLPKTEKGKRKKDYKQVKL